MSLATNAALYRAVAKLLTSWGWPVEYAAGWETRTNGGAIRTPSAVTVHHTGGRATATSYLLNPRDRPQLKVLANMHITHDHRIKILAAGSTSHGGYTHEPCYQRVVQGTAPLDRDLIPGADSTTFSINTRTVGIEVDGAGGKSEWDAWTIRAVTAVSAAFQIAAGWMRDGKAPRVGAHKEHTKRKPGDPYMSMGELRTRVASVVASGKPYGPTETPPVPTVPTVPDGATEPKPTPEVPTRLRVGTINGNVYGRGKTAESRVKALAKVVAKMNASLVALTDCPDDTTSGRMRTRLRKALPGGADRWRVWVSDDTPDAAILFDRTRVKPAGDSADVKRRRYHPTIKRHGSVTALFTVGGVRVAFSAYHLRPNSVSSLESQATAVQATARDALAFKAAVTVLAGDGMNADSWLDGWTVTRVGRNAKAPTYDGGGITDRIHVRGATPAAYTVLKTGTASDHDAVVAEVVMAVLGVDPDEQTDGEGEL